MRRSITINFGYILVGGDPPVTVAIPFRPVRSRSPRSQSPCSGPHHLFPLFVSIGPIRPIPGTARQGELVDRIEYLVDQTGDHVGQAWEELIKAEEYRSKARKVNESNR